MCMRPQHTFTYASPVSQLVGVKESHDSDKLPELDEIVYEVKDIVEKENFDFYEITEDEKEKSLSDFSGWEQDLESGNVDVTKNTAVFRILFFLSKMLMLAGVVLQLVNVFLRN